jgi:uncharacterized membrane protein YoaK (UPF0700 family)
MRDPLTRTLLILTFVTGIVDAVSFLALGGAFSAMQTGNVIFLGLGIGGASGAPVVAPLVALGGFLAGGAAAALLVPATTTSHGNRLRVAMTVEVGLLGLAAVLAALTDVHPGRFIAYLLIAILSVAMGLRNTIARGIGDPNLATTVLNLTLSAFSSTPTGIASEGELTLRAAAIGAILAGAVAGALLLKASLALAIAAAAAVVVAAAVTYAFD